MAGFQIDKVVNDKKNEVTIPLEVNLTYEEGETAPSVMRVFHTMRFPERSEREKHRQMMVSIRGQNIKATGSTEANFWLWKACWTHIEGYDGLPDTREQVNKLFEENNILRIHAESAAQALLDYVSAGTGEITKK